MLTPRRCVCLVLLISLSAPSAFAQDDVTLLFDEHTVAATKNLSQHFHPAARHPANPVIKRTQRWEGVGPYVFGNRMLKDDATGDLRLWYIAYDFVGNFYRWGYATSQDGLQWTKPELNLETIDGEPAGNCLPLGPHPEKGTRSIAFDPRPTTPTERKYLGIRFTYDGEFVSFSPDGIHWTEHPQNPVWHVPSDMIHVMFDVRRNQFIAYYKLWELSGTRIDGDLKSSAFTALMPTFTPKDNGNQTTTFTGPVVHLRDNAPAEVTSETFTLQSANQGADDGGGTSLSGAWSAKRVQAFACSDDGVHWKNEQVVLRADAKDPPTANIQYLFVMQRGGYYLGFATLHDERGEFRIQLATSGDGLSWKRLWREPWLDVGAEGAFDAGMILGPADPIIRDGEMWFPYGGFPIKHDTKRTDWEAAIGLATMRLDGFSSWHAGETPGELVTQPFTCNGSQLFVNADATDGEIRVEVQDADGNTIEGFEASACQPISIDTLKSSPTPSVRWLTGADLATLSGKTIRLRFTMKRADLYSFRVAGKE